MKVRICVMGILSSLMATFSTAATNDLQAGDSAPKVSAKNENGEVVEIKYDQAYTMVYFYPKADTPGCTAQACSLRDAYEELLQAGIRIYGVSTDTPEEQLKFKKKYQLPFTLLSDTDKKVAKAFGVPVRVGFTARQAFLIKGGKIVWLDRTASTKEQAKDILDFIKSN